MRNIFIFLLFFCVKNSNAQVTFIGLTGNTTVPNNYNGNGSLYLQAIGTTADAFINFEVFATGMAGSDACGTKTKARVILRRTSANDPTSVVASAPIIVTAICDGKNGNNDKYFVNLKAAIAGIPGRYSVEVQADIATGANPFDNANTLTTFNFRCPPAYYLTGAGGSTGNYYMPAAPCNGFAGLSDPIGGPNVDAMAQTAVGALNYFTVGEAANYRDMVVFAGTYYDMKDGKFQPGNPTIPISLNGRGSIPATGICPNETSPTLSMGAEINSFKLTNAGCNADVTGANMFYRVYKNGSTPPSYSSFVITFRDNCASNATGPVGHTFTMGGNCQNTNNVLDQRWQVTTGATNILPTFFPIPTNGIWNIDFYTETYLRNCAGVASTQTSTVNTTTFTVNDPNVSGSPCAYVLPVIFKNFNVTPQGSNTIFNWEVGATGNNVQKFEVQKSTNGTQFTTIGNVNYIANQHIYNFNYAAAETGLAYYRIALVTATNEIKYSKIIKVQNNKTAPILTNVVIGNEAVLTFNNFDKGNYGVTIIDITGKTILKNNLTISQNGTTIKTITLNNFAKGIYKIFVAKSNGTLTEGVTLFY